jgi:hypothetical protein
MALAVDRGLVGKRLRRRVEHTARAKPDVTTGRCCDSPGVGDSRCATNGHSNAPILRHASTRNASGECRAESSGNRCAVGSTDTDDEADSSAATDTDPNANPSAANGDADTDPKATATTDANGDATTKAAATRAAECV